MDPQATWDQLLCAYAEGDWDAIEERATELLEWLDRGGFPPKVLSKDVGADRVARSETPDAQAGRCLCAGAFFGYRFRRHITGDTACHMSWMILVVRRSMKPTHARRGLNGRLSSRELHADDVRERGKGIGS